VAVSKSISGVELVRLGINPHQSLPGGLEVGVGHLTFHAVTSLQSSQKLK